VAFYLSVKDGDASNIVFPRAQEATVAFFSHFFMLLSVQVEKL